MTVHVNWEVTVLQTAPHLGAVSDDFCASRFRNQICAVRFLAYLVIYEEAFRHAIFVQLFFLCNLR